MNLIRMIGRQPKPLLTAVGFLLVFFLWIIDHLTAPDLSFLIFYIAPVLLLTWFVGRTAGILISILSAAAWFVEDVMAHQAYSSPAIPYWNLAAKFGFFLLVIQILSSLKGALQREKLAEQERLEREIEVAQEVQTRLFPQKLPVMKTLDYAGICRPAHRVGGDYYDFLSLAPDRLGIAVGDISGKGIPAALLMASLQGCLRSYASLAGDDARKVVDEIGRQLCALTGGPKFATLFWGVYEERRCEFTYVNAGHNPPMLFHFPRFRTPARTDPVARTRSGAAERLSIGGTVLGIFPDAVYRQDTRILTSGDMMVIFTDGIPEAANGREEEFGEGRLEALLRENPALPAKSLCELVVSEVQSFLRGEPTQDDLTVVVVKVL